jgi:hypothetical protein
MFLRFSDIFWITPIIYKKDSYITASELNVELWSSIKKDLKPHREKIKQDKKAHSVKDQVRKSKLKE